MIVGNRKQFAFPFQYPPFPVSGLAFWAVPVAAGIIGDLFLPTVGACLHMASQLSGPALLQGPKGLLYLYRRLTLYFILSAKPMDNLRYFPGRIQGFGGYKVSNGL